MSVGLPRPVVRGARGAVACGHPLAAAAALHVFEAGGNAVDAAVAAAACLVVLLPDACGLGGDAMILVRVPEGEVAYNGSGAAPAELDGSVPTDGAATAAVPGAVAAWEAVHRGHGALPFADVLEPAERLAAEGFPVGECLLDAVANQRERLERGAGGWALLERLEPGDVVRQPELAALLSRIRDQGAVAFYEGQAAEAIERRVREDGGFLARRDLAEHRTVKRAPVRSTYRSVSLTFQPPVSQALLAGMVLRELERAGDESVEARLHRAIEAVEAAFAHRDDVGEPGAEERLLAAVLDVDPTRARRRGGPRGYSHTTAVTAADTGETVVSMLVSVFDDFGSAALVPDGGFLLNDRMTGFSSDPASPNAPAPGRRPVHTLSPALVDDGDRVFALATPGADGQVQTLVQVTVAVIDEGAGPAEALARARWRSQNGIVLMEEGFDPELAAALAARGHDLLWRPAGDPLFGAVAAAGFDLRRGTVFAVADPRRETTAAAV